MRLPRADKERLEAQAKKKVRDTSELAWLLVRDGLSRLERGDQMPDYIANA